MFATQMKCIALMLIAGVVALLSGCIDGEEEIFIEKDGSARVKAVYSAPLVIFSAGDAEELSLDIDAEVAKEEHLMLLVNRVDKQNGNRVLTLEIATGDVTKLEGSLSEHTLGKAPSKADKILHAIVGRISVAREGFSAKLDREIHLGPLLDEYLGEGGAAMLGDAEFRYTVHLPEAAGQSNAHEVLNEGRTLKWNHKLADCLEKPITLTMTAPIPLPWWVILAVVLPLIVVVWFIYLLMRRFGSGRRGVAASG